MTHSAQEKLKQSLILLLDDFDFDQISISKICKEAGVHRSTFYAYYDNQSDLLEDAMAYLADIFTTEFASLQETFEAEKERDSLLDSYYLLPYLTYIKNHQKLYKIYLKNPTDFQHEKVVEQHINEQFLNRYHAKGFTDEKMIRYMTHFYTAGIRRIIYDWVMDDCHDDITYIIKIIHTIIF
ncbi:TetR/AcrR family transcriptional regulator [Streptococcus gallolyticus]|uniref:TetR/AcrR family transcriptional regulator n=1 Tax=Streptococcus gallolyticus TaxID=315405 RepID=UPI0001E0F3E5|nr:TetR/AcrR family transcriptional regulator [Streptococcus gallolyticus]EFM28990.1 transcriptional regulator, TetR family [Streptococcus gallolyticus subsp. gallolyticus TX20005]QKI00238.1 TetR/AcrR family transcriptional regulator [Streptococcus gallolyticus]QWX86308.1 TetR/AcrR family transcriptional regulator [Streptococcus gallolyticus subsp. gallolyticus TX20005]